jgi:O-antigen ligase
MTTAPGRHRATRSAPAVRQRHVIAALGIYVIALFVFPSDLVLRVIGGQGYVAGLIGMLLFAAWAGSCVLGAHDPFAVRHPTRGALACLTAVSLICWAASSLRGVTAAQQLAADRWIMMLVVIAGVVLVTAEGIGTVDALVTILRLAVLGAAFCAFVAILQWLLTVDLSGVIRASLPGFSVDQSITVYEARGALQRVFGTAMHPIELGVVEGMMLPIAIVVAVYDKARDPLRRWFPVLLIATAIPASVSRSAVLAAVVSCLVLVLSLPARPRLTALVAFPVGAFVLAIARPGYLSTLVEFAGAGSSDSSIATRLSDWPLVVRLVESHPWLGSGGGTYLPDNLIDVLDNQYFKSGIELGLFGLTGLLAYFLVPVLTALSARLRSRDPRLRTIAAALAGAALAGAVCAYTFDALSFNMFVGLQAFVAGCAGACWILARRESRPTTSPLRPVQGS